MQVNKQTQPPQGLRSDQAQATSANARFHHKPVDRAICGVVVGKDHDASSWPERSPDQSLVSNRVESNNTISIVPTDGTPLRLAANRRVTADDSPHSPASPTSDRWHQSRCDQQSPVAHSRPPASCNSSTADSLQRDSYGGARPKNRRPAILNSNGTPTHRNTYKSPSLTAIAPWFLARHSQDDYCKTLGKVTADLNDRIVDLNSPTTEPFTGYDARPLPPDRSVGNGGRPAYNRVDPPPCHVTAGSDYYGLPPAPADSRTQQSGNPECSAGARQHQGAAAISNRSTDVAGGFLPAYSGNGYSSSVRSKKSEEVAKTTTNIGVTVPAMPDHRADEPASGQPQNSSGVPFTSTASCATSTFEIDMHEGLRKLEQYADEVCATATDEAVIVRINESLRELERQVDEYCAQAEEIRQRMEEQEERVEFAASIRRKEDEIRAERRRKKQEREKVELAWAESWPVKQNVITGEAPWLCEHYQRHCQVKFDCCEVFYPCHRCHNNSEECSNEVAKAIQATHYKCSICNHEDEIDENSQHCSGCEVKMSAYFCSLCKHFTGVDKNPYHCEKCGICRIYKDRSFHCDVCNVCLDTRLEGKHKCRADSGHDSCCICLEDAFSGCQILPCSHKVHRKCAIAMIQHNIRTCPMCRHPLYSPAPE